MPILLKRLAFFAAFLQSNIKYSSKFSWRSITTPYRCLLSLIFFWPIFAQIASDLWPEIIRWHLFSGSCSQTILFLGLHRVLAYLPSFPGLNHMHEMLYHLQNCIHLLTRHIEQILYINIKEERTKNRTLQYRKNNFTSRTCTFINFCSLVSVT